MTQEQFKELLRSQQGELDAVLMYQRLAKVVKTEKEREAFLQLAKEEGRHASVFHAYTKEPLQPKKGMALIMPILYRLLGKKRLYKMIAKGEYDAAVGYEHLIADFPEVESVGKVFSFAKYLLARLDRVSLTYLWQSEETLMINSLDHKSFPSMTN